MTKAIYPAASGTEDPFATESVPNDEGSAGRLVRAADAAGSTECGSTGPSPSGLPPITTTVYITRDSRLSKSTADTVYFWDHMPDRLRHGVWASALKPRHHMPAREFTKIYGLLLLPGEGAEIKLNITHSAGDSND